MAKKRMTMNPHPYGEEAEKAMKVIYGIESRRQMVTLHRILADFADDGFTEDEILDAVNAFQQSDPKTHSLRFFRAFARTHVQRQRSTVTQHAEIW